MASHPKPDILVCPKCGEIGFADAVPRYALRGASRYTSAMGIREELGPFTESLEWPCAVCGYTISTPCADAEARSDGA